MMNHVPGFTRLYNALLLGVIRQESKGTPDAHELSCPATGKGVHTAATGQHCQRGSMKASSVLALQGMVLACVLGYAAALFAVGAASAFGLYHGARLCS